MMATSDQPSEDCDDFLDTAPGWWPKRAPGVGASRNFLLFNEAFGVFKFLSRVTNLGRRFVATWDVILRLVARSFVLGFGHGLRRYSREPAQGEEAGPRASRAR